MEEYCDSIKDFYKKGLKSTEFCLGLSIEPKPVEEMGKEDLRLWAKYIFIEYDNNFYSKNWDHDLVCVLLGIKKLALIENDYFPMPSKRHYAKIIAEAKEDESDGDEGDESDVDFDYYLRYVATQKCQLNKITMYNDDDPTTIYYLRDNWRDAVLLYLYHNGLMSYRPMGQLEFDLFQGILLGYNYSSMVNYQIDVDSEVELLEENESFKRFLYENQEDKDVKRYHLLLKKGYYTLPILKQLIYRSGLLFKDNLLEKLYQKYYILYQKMDKRVRPQFERISYIIEKLKRNMDENPHYRTFALGLETERDFLD